MATMRPRLVPLAAIFPVTLALLGVTQTATAAERPDVVLICADDHAAYVCGAYGNAIVRTPALDAFAASGLRFTHAYCNSPVCTASRQSFLTGRYPRTIGVTELKTPLPESETTLAELLAGAGYRTAAVGKMHFNSQLTHGFEVRIDEPDYARWRRERPAVHIPPGLAVQPPWKPFRDPAATWLNAAIRPVGERDADMQGTFFAEAAARLLADRTDPRPLFLIVSFYEPHSPFRFPLEFAGRHAPDEFIVPPVDESDRDDIPAEFRDLTDADKRGITAAYHTSIEFLDSNIGIVLAAIDASGRSRANVISMSDHGYMLGQHGRFEKHCMFEPAVRVPLIVRAPGITSAGTTCNALVELIDVAPTILELCGVAAPAAMQGRSLVPLLRDPATKHRPQVIVEYAPNDELMICDGRWKLMYERGARLREDGYATGHAPGGERIRLFDLQADPDERHDVALLKKNSAIRDALLARLADHVRSTSRQPELVPQTDDDRAVLAWGSQPRDMPAK